jgi:hypothetical protein
LKHPKPKELEVFCQQYGIELPVACEQIKAGRNSEVWRLFNDQGQWILKNYYQHSTDSRDRLGTEYGFLTFLENHKIDQVPKPIGIDHRFGRGLYTFLSGKRPTQITSSHICQAAAFFRSINEYRCADVAAELPLAADACFSIQEHLDLAGIRVQRLTDLKEQTEVEHEAKAFVMEQIVPLWGRLQSKFIQERLHPSLNKALSPEMRVLSPSDFGFHNALEYKGNLSFIDFEYAGWDDPTKLLCDFICQPEVPVSASQGKQFMVDSLLDFPNTQLILHRVETLIQVHRLKWCCILLNEFRLEDRLRRIHAGFTLESLLEQQLDKAKSYFDNYLANFA